MVVPLVTSHKPTMITTYVRGEVIRCMLQQTILGGASPPTVLRDSPTTGLNGREAAWERSEWGSAVCSAVLCV